MNRRCVRYGWRTHFPHPTPKRAEAQQTGAHHFCGLPVNRPNNPDSLTTSALNEWLAVWAASLLIVNHSSK